MFAKWTCGIWNFPQELSMGCGVASACSTFARKTLARPFLKPWRASFLCPAPRAANRVVKAIISGMEREIYVQEWDQTEIEAIVRKAGFTIIQSRPFLRERGRYPVLSFLMHT